MRSLVHVAVIHSPEDLGSWAASAEERYRLRFGAEKWGEHLDWIGRLWGLIESEVDPLAVASRRVKVYQDGLPVCSRELDIARTVAAQGSPNYRLIVRLVDRGAELVGTEDPALLLEELRLLRAQPERALDEKLNPAVAAQVMASMAKRDRFMATRINSTLEQDELGFLFVGLLHKVDSYLDPDIRVRHLTDELLSRMSSEERANDSAARQPRGTNGSARGDESRGRRG